MGRGDDDLLGADPLVGVSVALGRGSPDCREGRLEPFALLVTVDERALGAVEPVRVVAAPVRVVAVPVPVVAVPVPAVADGVLVVAGPVERAVVDLPTWDETARDFVAAGLVLVGAGALVVPEATCSGDFAASSGESTVQTTAPEHRGLPDHDTPTITAPPIATATPAATSGLSHRLWRVRRWVPRRRAIRAD